jgi:hypothetical protein
MEPEHARCRKIELLQAHKDAVLGPDVGVEQAVGRLDANDIAPHRAVVRRDHRDVRPPRPAALQLRQLVNSLPRHELTSVAQQISQQRSALGDQVHPSHAAADMQCLGTRVKRSGRGPSLTWTTVGKESDSLRDLVVPV